MRSNLLSQTRNDEIAPTAVGRSNRFPPEIIIPTKKRKKKEKSNLKIIAQPNATSLGFRNRRRRRRRHRTLAGDGGGGGGGGRNPSETLEVRHAV